MLVGYARVSSQDQNPDLQVDALRGAGCEKIFVEKASGAQTDRPQLAAALHFMRDQQGDVLVVWKLDRLARSLSQLINLIESLEKRQIGFRSLTELIDTTTASGRLVFQIFGAMAEFERELIRERVKAGLANAAKHGRYAGRPKAKRERDRDAVAIRKLRDQGQSYGEIAAELGRSKSDIYRICMTLRRAAV